uniref:C2H2-type domain-containing protein n=1 Tax=Ditylenchus dipsaci TaxID=166011 RepID=A0A915EF42_9BILA
MHKADLDSNIFNCSTSEGGIAAGTVLGPYSVTRLMINQDDDVKVADELKFKIKDLNGVEHVFGLLDFEAVHILKQISPAISGFTANCSVVATNGDKQVFVVVTKAVQRPKDLKAIFITDVHHKKRCASLQDNNKKFECPKCPVSFTNPEILKRHQSFYCKQDVAARISPKSNSELIRPFKSTTEKSAEKTGDNQPRASLPSTSTNTQPQTISQPQQENSALIILPVAFHNHPDEQLVQLIGLPQTIIPVAIHKQASPQLLFNQPLLLDAVHMNQLILPQGMQVPIAADSTSSNPDFYLPLAFVQHQKINSRTAVVPDCSTLVVGETSPLHFDIGPCTSNGRNADLEPSKEKTQHSTPTIITLNKELKRNRFESIEEDIVPLDLSLHKHSRTTPTDITVLPSSSCILQVTDQPQLVQQSKRYLCECGVSFISVDTLRAHRKFYCRNRVPSDSIEVDEKSKESNVQKRSEHQDSKEVSRVVDRKKLTLQSFVCIICSYKGYSPRGIKHHLRSSHAMDTQKHVNLLDFVHSVNIVKTS